jgi:hypothetical protein
MPSPQQYYPVVLPPGPEWLATAFLTPKLAPTPVVTRMPILAPGVAVLPTLMRVEAADTVRCPSLWGAAYDVSFLMHAYSPSEIEAEQLSTLAIAQVSAVTGTTIVGWYIVEVMTVVGGRRLSDPEVPADLVRYRSAVTWKVAGQPQ